MRLRFLGGALLLLSFAASSRGQLGSAAAALERGDPGSAESILKAALRERPNDVSLLSLLAITLDSEKRYAESGAVYRRALKLTPNSASLLNNYGNHLLAVGESKQARAAFLKVIALRPDHPNANLQLASLASDQGDGRTALRYLARLSGSETSAPPVRILRMRALYLCGRDKEADTALAQLEDSAQSDPKLAFSAGLALAAVKKYDQAERLFSLTLKSVPGDFDALYNLGLAAFHAGHSDRAQDALQTALKERPQDVDTLYNLAVVTINLKQRPAALSLLAQAVRLDPSRAQVQLTLAETLSALGYYADALTTYQTYLKLAPHDAAAEREHAFMLGICGPPGEGLSKLETFLRAHPNDIAAHYEIAVLKANVDTSSAVAHIERAIQLQPDFVPARFGRGVLSYLQGRFSDALPDLEFAAEHDSDNPVVLDHLGKIYLQLARYTDAVKVLHKASEFAPNDSTVWFHLSRALAATGQKEESRAALDRFRALGSEQVGHVPPPGFADLLELPPEQLYAQYRIEVERRATANPGDTAASVRYLKLLLDEGRTKDASGIAQKILTAKPSASLAAEAGRILLDADQNADAKLLLDYAVSIAPTSQSRVDLALALFHTEGAQPGLAQLDKIPEAQRSGDYYLARSQMLDATGNSDEALATLQQGIDKTPSLPSLYRAACLFLVRRQRPEDAVRLMERATRVLSEDRNVLVLQAAMFAFARRADQAEAALKRIQDRWPEWFAPYVTYGILLEGLNRSEEALNQFQTAIALGGSSAQLYYYLARSTLNAAPDRVADAAKAIDQAVTLSPADPFIQSLAGRIAYQRRDYSAAVQHLEEAIRLRPNFLQARYTLTQAYKAMGRNQDAERQAEEIQRLRAQNQLMDERDAEDEVRIY